MIRVSVRLSGLLADYYKTSRRVKSETAELPDGSTVMDLIRAYSIPAEKAHMIVVNRHKRDPRTVLKDRDAIWILPLAHGG